MAKKELIKHIKYSLEIGTDYTLTDEDAVEIIKALEQEPSVKDIHKEREQTYMFGYEDASEKFRTDPCEDCISRQAVLDLIADYDLSMGQVVKAIHALPQVAPQQKIGHWIEGKYRDDDIRYNDSSYKCNKCGRIVDFKENYCPDCGTKMEVEE